MPHIKLEYTANVRLPDNIQALFTDVHQLIHRVAGVNIGNCKSRLYPLEDFWIGDGALNSSDQSANGLAPGFVHLEVRFVEGRSIEIKNKLAEILKQTLLDHLDGMPELLDLQVSVEVSDIVLQEYAKYPAGSLTSQ